MKYANKHNPLSNFHRSTKQLKIPKGVLVGTLFQATSSINTVQWKRTEVFEIIPDFYSDIQEKNDMLVIRPFAGCVDTLKIICGQITSNETLSFEQRVDKTFQDVKSLENIHLINMAKGHARVLTDKIFKFFTDSNSKRRSYEEYWEAFVNYESITLSKFELAKISKDYPFHMITITPKFLAEEAHSKALKDFPRSTCSSNPKICAAQSLAFFELLAPEEDKAKRTLHLKLGSSSKIAKHELDKVVIGTIPDNTKDYTQWKPIWW